MSTFEFTVLDESDDLIVVDKPAPLQVYARKPGDAPGLLEGLRELLVYDIANGASLSIINRLDRETSGVVLVAKNRVTAHALSRVMAARQAHKIYHAVVHGTPSADSWSCDLPLARRRDHFEHSPVWVEQAVHPSGRPSRTDFRVLRRAPGFSLIEARPHTGRMHQVRVHLQATGYPVAGDKLYGPHGRQPYLEMTSTGRTTTALALPRQALHCHQMEIPGLASWSSPTPPEFLALIGNPSTIPQV